MTQDTLPQRSWFNFRMPDILLAVMFAAMIVLAHTASDRAYLAGIAILRARSKAKLPWLGTLSGRITSAATSVGLQLVMCYLLLGSIDSKYFPLILLLPVASSSHLPWV